MAQPIHGAVHFWSEQLSSPPCDTLEDRFDGSDAIENVTCEECLQALTGEAGGFASQEGEGSTTRFSGDEHPGP